MASRDSYDDALAQRLALLREELTGVRDEAEVETVVRPRGGFTDEALSTEIRLPGRHASRRFPAASRFSGALLGPGPVAVVAVLLAFGLGVAAWLALRSQPEELPLAVPVAGGLATPVAGASAGASPGGGAGAATPRDVVVHVAGKVQRPGIVVLSQGARVVDALEAAGGARPGVELTDLNLARLLVDGEQVLVGVAPPAGAPAPAAGGAGAVSGKVNLNTASAAQLEELPGVGPVTAAAIVAFRQEHGSFRSVDQLLDVSGIGEATLAEIAPHATV